MGFRRRAHLPGLTLGTIVVVSAASAADWPMWRFDAGRTAATPDELPADLHLQWVRVLPPPRPAWPPDQDKLQFDGSYEPILVGGTLIVPSMTADWVSGWDADTGEERWRFYTDGPVRFAPAALAGKVYCVSDDGWLYCLNADSGSLVWKFRGGPSERRLLGNGRLISAWPARGGPVILDGTVYFAASIWPLMGTFIHAIDASQGKAIWSNTGSGSTYLVQQHHSEAFAGVSPQGYMAATADRLLVSGGRTVPAGYDRQTGQFLYFNVSDRTYGKDAGGYAVATAEKWFFNGSTMYALAEGAGVIEAGASVLSAGLAISADAKGVITAHRFRPVQEEYIDRKGKTQTRAALRKAWEVSTDPAIRRVFIRAGSKLYGSGDNGLIAAVRVPESSGSAKIVWRGQIEGEVWNMLAGDGKLFVVTRQGAICCFGPRSGEVRRYELAPGRPSDAATDHWERRAEDILAQTGVSQGYCLVFGVGTGRLVEEIVGQSDLHVIGFGPDVRRIESLRKTLDEAGLYGQRVALHAGSVMSVELPPYLASLVTFEDLEAAGVKAGRAFAEKVFACLRPYGGTACHLGTADEVAAFEDAFGSLGPQLAPSGSSGGKLAMVTRSGPLPGAGDWTHQYADAANTVVSADSLVRAPLGILWFGGPANTGILPRHGHGPSPQVVAGRLFIEGPDLLRAVDVYTGRLLWERNLPGVGRFYDNTSHEPGANAIGSNYVSLTDAVYVVMGSSCLRLDPNTGRTVAELRLAPEGEDGRPPEWGFLAAWKDLLIAGLSPMSYWVPDFDPIEFKDLKKEELAEVVGVIRSLTRAEGERPAGEGDDNLRSFIAEALNRLLNDPELMERIPGDLKARATEDRKRAETVAAVQNRIREHRRGRSTPQDGDQRLRELNRRLLSYFYRLPPMRERLDPGRRTLDRTASERLTVLDRTSGRALWSCEARHGFRHNAIVIGDGKVFFIDRLPDEVVGRMQRRGEAVPQNARMAAVDIRTGSEIWSIEKEVFGTWLSYSQDAGLLIQASSRERDRATDEAGKGIAAHRIQDGQVVWRSDLEYGGPVLLHGDTIITQAGKGGALDLRTGRPRVRSHPLTGRPVPWQYTRNYGCNTVIGSEHLLTFRSAAAGFYDLAGDGGTGNLGGFRSGCTSNLIVADGVLNAPDYTRTCTCSYQNQSSLALIHDPDAEMWTFNAVAQADAPVVRVGLNFGGPGDRMAADGVLWLDYPSVGGPSPDIPVRLVPDKPKWFRNHASWMRGGPLKWVTASGGRGLRELVLTLAKGVASPRNYTVRLYFADPDNRRAGERVFDVALQGKKVLPQWDIVRETGAPMIGVMQEFENVPVADELAVSLTPSGLDRTGETILCGVEVVAEEGRAR